MTGDDTVGRTSAVSGSLVIAGRQVTSAAFRIDLTGVEVGGKAQPQFAISLCTGRFGGTLRAPAGPASSARWPTTEWRNSCTPSSSGPEPWPSSPAALTFKSR